ncbi:MAG: nitroreductase family protein [Bacteroidales bacterium]|nr:nitroreductase family protein [Bacteroidales bacterium]
MENASVIDCLLKHKSIRKYTADPVPESVLHQVLEAGTRAATTGNMQLYSVIVTKDPARKKALAPLHFNQPMITEAPVVLTFTADVNRFQQWCEQREAGRAYDNLLWYVCATLDCMLMAQNTVVAAEALGLGTCFLGTTLYTAKEQCAFFELPAGVMPLTTLTLGYPAEQPEATDRLPLEGIVHSERYTPYTPQAIDRLFGPKESSELTRRLLAENGLPNLAQIFTLRRYPLADNLTFSQHYLELLKTQGFLDKK